MFSSLGLRKQDTLVLHVREEFDLNELLDYFNATSIDVILPEWLPRRPLICQTIALLPENVRDHMFNVGSNAVDFWNHFIRVICDRDARINKSFNSETIFDVFIQLANLSRTKPGNVGPINQRELQEAFESVVGALPVENAAVMLQRLPSLGRAEDAKRSTISKRWINSLQELGQSVLAKAMKDKVGGYANLAGRAAASANRTLAADIVASFMRVPRDDLNLNGLVVSDAAISELDMSTSGVSNVKLSECTIDELILPSTTPVGVQIEKSLITKVAGASAEEGLPAWLSDNSIEENDSVRTMRRIRDAGLSPGQEVLVVMLKKIFFQPGTGRKEEALLRGFEAGKYNKVAKKVLGALLAEKAIGTFKGKEGTVYTPNRAMTSRLKAVLDELKSSQDPLWRAVSVF